MCMTTLRREKLLYNTHNANTLSLTCIFHISIHSLGLLFNVSSSFHVQMITLTARKNANEENKIVSFFSCARRRQHHNTFFSRSHDSLANTFTWMFVDVVVQFHIQINALTRRNLQLEKHAILFLLFFCFLIFSDCALILSTHAASAKYEREIDACYNVTQKGIPNKCHSFENIHKYTQKTHFVIICVFHFSHCDSCIHFHLGPTLYSRPFLASCSYLDVTMRKMQTKKNVSCFSACVWTQHHNIFSHTQISSANAIT